MVYIKYVAEVYHCSALERTLYQNFLALPILVLFMTTGVENIVYLKHQLHLTVRTWL